MAVAAATADHGADSRREQEGANGETAPSVLLCFVWVWASLWGSSSRHMGRRARRESFRHRGGDDGNRVKLIEKECRRLGDRQKTIEAVLQEHVLETEKSLENVAQTMCVFPVTVTPPTCGTCFTLWHWPQKQCKRIKPSACS